MRPLLLGCVLALFACGGGVAARDLGAGDDAAVPDAFVDLVCRTLCVRPSDCALSYADDERCPPGFVCASSFMCVDGGMP